MEWSILLKCPHCLHETVIESGEAIECENCHAKPDIVWDGRGGMKHHTLGRAVKG